MIPKPGYKTTEFLATLAASVGFLAAALSSNLTPKYAAYATSISVGAYAVSRGITKLGAYLSTRPVVQAPAPPAPPPAG
jgi:hypothetical protein